ncbi:MAG: hypothetical protein GF364_04590 [Candidatus Lokiarchaeota archaeon]|nr:hypothetical protein [Candidatus Lokiarchaeota archaeon]
MTSNLKKRFYFIQGINSNFEFTGDFQTIDSDSAVTKDKFIELLSKLPVPPEDINKNEELCAPHIGFSNNDPWFMIARNGLTEWSVIYDTDVYKNFTEDNVIHDFKTLRKVLDFIWEK